MLQDIINCQHDELWLSHISH